MSWQFESNAKWLLELNPFVHCQLNDYISIPQEILSKGQNYF